MLLVVRSQLSLLLLILVTTHLTAKSNKLIRLDYIDFFFLNRIKVAGRNLTANENGLPQPSPSAGSCRLTINLKCGGTPEAKATLS